MYKKIDMSKLIVWDIETLINCIIVCCREVATGAKKEFILFDNVKYKDQPSALYKFIKSCIKQNYTFIGFNSINFDAQVLDLFYNWCSEPQDPLYEMENSFIIDELYKESQRVIKLPKDDSFKDLVNESKLFAPQIDVYKQLHYDRKRTSLKWVQFSMRYTNIEEMPIPHDEPITLQKIPEVLSYCWNDVDSTYEFFTKVKYETDVRLEMSKQFKVDIVNASEPRMVREIFATFITKQMGLDYYDLKKLRTVRKYVAFNDIIFPYVKYVSPQLKEMLDVFQGTVVNTTPGYVAPSKKEIKSGAVNESVFEYNLNFHGMQVDLGLGGIHGFAGGGVYTHADDEVIEDADGTSFYPFLAIQNGLRPEHLGDAFNAVYPMMFEERKKYAKKDPRNYIFKIILNSAYGLSKEINGYLYDPKFTYAITINGQLSLMMLAEALSLSVPGIEFIQMNTDGLTYKYKKIHAEIVRKICRWWERTTKISLEYEYYDKMIFRDVNNYMAVNTKGDVKKKGIFEVDMPYHKNPSSLIIPMALEQYFLNGVAPEDYITRPDHNIFDFCNGVKKTSDFKLNLSKQFGGAELLEEQQKVTRYIVSKPHENAGRLFKDYHDGRRISIEAGKYIIPLNRINADQLQASLYPIDYDDYCKETRKIIEAISPTITQTTLF